MKYLKILRLPNLFLLALMQLTFRYGFLIHQDVPLALADWQYLLLVLATVLIAAAGYVINDIFDQDSDAINKPKKAIVGKSITEGKAYNIYVGLNIAGVAIGFYLSNVILHPSFAVLFILIAASLYLYATNLKQTPVLGNVVVAALLALSVLIIGIFDLFPATYEANQKEMGVLFKILLDYAFFGFFINFIREIAKDAEDSKGDYNAGIKTLPIIIGANRTAKVIFALVLVAAVLVLMYLNNHLMNNDLYYATIYGLIVVVAPLLYISFKSWEAKTTADFHHISTVLKWVIFFGLLSIAVITYNIKINA
jgi:4-hydroxybenzoate polyprenyltransferase